MAVMGDGALPSGIVFEAMNNAAGLKKDLLVILNDNKMGICPRVGGLAQYLDKARMAPFYDGLKRDVSWLLNKLPVVGEPAEYVLGQFKDAVKTFLHGGMLFEEMGFRYIGPVDGHDLRSLRTIWRWSKRSKGPVLLHVFTEKGHGFKPACEDPVRFHTPPVFSRNANGEIDRSRKARRPPTPTLPATRSTRPCSRDTRVTVLTAAMCEGNKLQKVRDEFPDRFFDTGICEGHAVAFAAGMAKSGLRPIVDIYTTFLQRSFDQIFQEVALQNLPVTFCLDRAGLCGPDGPTHHGVFDNSYMRVFPNIVLMAPGDALEMGPLLDFALAYPGPVVDPLSKGQRRDRGSSPRSHRVGTGRSHRLGNRRHVHRLRCPVGRLRQGGPPPAGGRARRRRRQRPVRQAARHRNDPPGDRSDGLRADRGREHRLWRLRLGRAGSGRGGRRRHGQHSLPGHPGSLH